MAHELPIYNDRRGVVPSTRDLARGWNYLLFWGAPLALIVLASIANPLLRLSFVQFGILLVAGTAWIGALCLINAVRCGRSHCLLDGILLPVLAGIGGLNLLQIVNLSWTTYLSAFWLILLASLVLECVVGSYPRARNSS